MSSRGEAMKYISDMTQLEAIYGAPVPTSISKVADHLTPEYLAWIMASRFCVLSTVGPEGTDGTPRGDDGPVVAVKDERTLLMPDWAGNNRIDSLRNILRDPRCSLMFMVAGSNNIVRVNGQARISADEALRGQFSRKGMLPRTVLVINIDEVYFQCAKAIFRAGLWNVSEKPDVPSAGDFIKAMTKGAEGGSAYDATYDERAKTQLWERDY